MSEQAAETVETGAVVTEQGKEAVKAFTAITSQDDFDRAIQARIARESAKYADYDEVKAKADKFTEIENANKTELQKKDDRIAELEAENGGLKSKTLRSSVAAAKGVPAELLSGSTKEELEAAADALIKFRGEQGGKKLLIPNEGKSSTEQPTDESEFVSELFSRGD